MQQAERFPGSYEGVRWILAGILLTLVGLIGDLVTHIVQPDRHEELIQLGTGGNPWHVVLFVGIMLSGIEATRWGLRQGSRRGRALAGATSGLLLAVLLGGALAAVKAAGEPNVVAGGSHVHPVVNATNTGTTSSVAHHLHGAAATQDAEGSSFFGHDHAPGPVTRAERLVMNRQLAAAKVATFKYRDIAVAKADGYFQVTQFIPGLGLHLVNLKIPNTRFDPARPEILLYQPEGSRMVLAGVAYSFDHTTNTPPEGFAGGADVWHFHRNLCFSSAGTVSIAASKADCDGVFQAQTDWLLHAWIWRHNPRGVFTEYNTTVR